MNIIEQSFDTVKSLVKEKNLKDVKKLAVKINNPAYHKQFLLDHPTNRYGFPMRTYNNIYARAAKSILNVISSDSPEEIKIKNIETELAWLYNDYSRKLLWKDL